MPGMLAAPILLCDHCTSPSSSVPERQRGSGKVVLDQPSRQSCRAVQDKPITESVHFTTAMVGFTMLAIQGSLTKLFEGQNAQVARTAHAFFGTATMGLFLFHASQVLQMCLFFGRVLLCHLKHAAPPSRQPSAPLRERLPLSHSCSVLTLCWMLRVSVQGLALGFALSKEAAPMVQAAASAAPNIVAAL